MLQEQTELVGETRPVCLRS